MFLFQILTEGSLALADVTKYVLEGIVAFNEKIRILELINRGGAVAQWLRARSAIRKATTFELANKMFSNVH